MERSSAEAYRRDGHASVPGWFFAADADLFSVVNDVQRDAAISGDLLEIGTYMGKSAIALGYLVADGEELTVCDLFDREATSECSAEENERTYGSLTRADFERHYLRFHARLPTVVEGPSLHLADTCAAGSYRFMHVDGSHVYPDVVSDLMLTKELAVGTCAVVAIDDIVSTHTPGVWDAAWECVHVHGLKPFAVASKMYATWGDPPGGFTNALRAGISAHPRLTSEDHPSSFGSVLLVQEKTDPAKLPEVSRRGRFAQDWLPPRLLRLLT